MLIPLSWLSEYVDIDQDAKGLADILTMAGLEVESVADGVIDVSVTANRADCLSMVGLAREIAAFTGRQVKDPTRRLSELLPSVTHDIQVLIESADLCQRYAGVIVRNVSVAPSPAWLRDRLTEAGLPVVNNVVDVTSYVMWELGQPLHAFDLNRFKSTSIMVRSSRGGEAITTLDHRRRELPEGVVLICDAETPIAIAGVMGGLDTEVTSGSRDVFLEAANFSPALIRRAVKALGLLTDASYRFQRNIDSTICVVAASRAAELIASICRGAQMSSRVDIDLRTESPKVVAIDSAAVNKLLGTSLTSAEVVDRLTRLGMRVMRADIPGGFNVFVPTWRRDIEGSHDLIEEVARLSGYELIPTSLGAGDLRREPGEPTGRRLKYVREILLECGLNEVVTYSLCQRSDLERCGLLDETTIIELRNPLSQDYSVMRTSILPSLLDVMARNWRNGVADVNIFDLGKVYMRGTSVGHPVEGHRVGIALMGSTWRNRWNLTPEGTSADFFSCKGIVQELLLRIGVDSNAEYKEVSHPTLQVGRAAELWVEGRPIGVLGEVKDIIRDDYALPDGQPAYVVELDFERLKEHARLSPRFSAIPRFQPVERDIALVIKNAIPAESVARSIREAGGNLLTSCTLFDVYKSDALGTGVKSVGYRLVFRHSSRTLETTEIDHLMDSILQRLKTDFAVEIR